ncbi:inverse autotransporter beta domain-containing protein [Xenorhabdus sp. IM139775]|uniref:inverse autotransporter beta domain-containing protein n=1 Tax=Xenorhabdus sp. IM139775 TaxID=3025876 RepID=UPI0023594F9C|nr:inverse autotransporter beta domain-containing protein [Xenorhabdus sp. IM139775]MDC9594463.1 inverse autotransporter beta domain-containing protein [Xenorhabdus sp. IM139775]
MSSYIGNKFILFLPYIGSLFLPLISLNALAIGEKNIEHQTPKVASEKPLDNRGDETAGFIAQNIQTVAQALSSSPSELTEQAKYYATSYALGKLNGVVSSETQKWLSQFGTAKINFALDRKGKLDNGSLDMLLPLYDNKTDWLAFSQFGYRHKDSRHTLNVGLGGRYFTPSWMYGLNTFFDHDVTGKNQRLGIGAEVWTDYVKLSANSYWRLTKWRQSLEKQDWEERPANGYDLTGEFYLPVYPNLGGKLGFEQYLGDNVALFNRDSKQKNPSLGRIGLNYTPVSLLTMGVDYKYGGSQHSETLFQANLNYRFGVPFDVQLSPDSVASMRTLAGSRYDLVERNNHIVLDHRKKPDELQLILPQSTIMGHSQQKWPSPIPVTANLKSRVKRIIWQADESFTKNGGSISGIGGDEMIALVLPVYVPAGQNTHMINVIAEDNNGKLTKPTILSVVVQPVEVKQFSAEKVPSAADGEESYHLLATLAYGAADTALIPDTEFEKVKWFVEPKNGDVKDVKVDWQETSKTNAQGQLQATVSSSQPLKDVQVFLEMPGMPRKHIGDIGFSGLISDFNIQSIKPMVEGPLLFRDSGYTFMAEVKNAQGNPLRNQKVDIKWYSETPHDGMKWSSVQDTTNNDGRLFATLTSNKPVENIKVWASMDGGKTITYVDKPVTFVGDIKIGEVIVKSPDKVLNGDGKRAYIYMAQVTDAASGDPIPHLTFNHDKVIWSVANHDKFDYGKLQKEGKLIFGDTSLTTNDQGYLTTTLSSSVGLNNVKTKLEFLTKEGKQEQIADTAVNFVPVDQPVGLYVYNVSDFSVDKFFNSHENGPYNLFDSLLGELRMDEDTPLIEDSSIEEGDYKIVSGQAVSQFISFGADGNGLMTFQASTVPTQVRATVTDKQTGAMRAYTYTIKPLRYFMVYEAGEIHAQTESCDHQKRRTGDPNKPFDGYLSTQSVKVTDLWPLSWQAPNANPVHNVKYGTTLLEEFPNIMEWGLIGNARGTPEIDLKDAILVYDDRQFGTSIQDRYVGFNVNSHEVVARKDVDKQVVCLAASDYLL